MQTLLARLFCILPWVILFVLVVAVTVLAVRLRSEARKARSSTLAEDEEGVKAMYLNGSWDINLHWDIVLLRRKNLRVGLPKIHFEKHIRWALMWWP